MDVKVTPVKFQHFYYNLILGFIIKFYHFIDHLQGGFNGKKIKAKMVFKTASVTIGKLAEQPKLLIHNEL